MREGQIFCGQHDQQRVSDHHRRLDAIGNGTDVVPSLALGEAMGQPRIKAVAHEVRKGDARQNGAEDKLPRKIQDLAAQADGDDELNNVIETDADKAVEIAANKKLR